MEKSDLRAPFATTLAHFTQMLHSESPLISSRMEGLFNYQRSPGQQQPGKIDVLSLATAIRSEEGTDIIGLSDSSSKVWARGSGVVWIDSLVSATGGYLLHSRVLTIIVLSWLDFL